MATTAVLDARSTPAKPGLPPVFKREGVVYAIAFDLDIEQVRLYYGDPYDNAFFEIRRLLEGHQFQWHQGLYLGSSCVTAASVMEAVIDLTTRMPWFAACVRDIRMLRIEEVNDLMPVIQRLAKKLHLSPMAMAIGMNEMVKSGMKQEDIAAEYSCTRPYVSMYLNLLNLVKPAQMLVHRGVMGTKMAIEVGRLSPAQQLVECEKLEPGSSHLNKLENESEED